METTWTALTPADLDDYLVARQVAALRTKALADGQTDPILDILADITAEVRNYIRGCASNTLSTDPTTIPAELRRHAAALAIEAAQPRLNLPLTEDQRTAATNARALLRDVAACRYPVTSPSSPQALPTDQGLTARPTISARPHTYTRDHQDGI